MSNNEIKLMVDEVSIGMYITRLDKPWLDTPFMLQGFMVNDREDLELLKQHCKHCYVDRVRSKNFDPSKIDRLSRITTKHHIKQPPPNRPVIKKEIKLDKPSKDIISMFFAHSLSAPKVQLKAMEGVPI